MKIGISGTSGKLGSAVLRELESRGAGHKIIAISRTPKAVADGVEWRQGDYDKPETLRQAYTELDRLLLIPSADLQPGVRGRQLKAAIEAALASDVKHIVLLSAAGTREVPPHALGSGYWIGEQTLIKTAPRWTILRMNYYSESLGDEIKMSLGSGVLVGLGEGRVAFISRNDVAAAAAGVLLGDNHAGAIYNLTGPAAVTGPERAAIASEVTGKSISYLTLTEGDLRGGLAQAQLPEPIVNALVEIKQNFVGGKFDIVTGDVARLSGNQPKTLHEALRSYLAPIAQ